jgi:CRP-like cAMP-binding protein
MELFKEFNEAEIETFLDLVEAQTHPVGDCIVRQDEPGDSMYFMVSGTARVIHMGRGRRFDLATLNPGDFFGEIALVDEGPRSATVEVTAEAEVLKISKGVMRALAGVYPSAAFKMLLTMGRVMVRRMRSGNKKYIDSLLVAADAKD